MPNDSYHCTVPALTGLMGQHTEPHQPAFTTRDIKDKKWQFENENEVV
jgi:hypothetical protein